MVSSVAMMRARASCSSSCAAGWRCQATKFRRLELLAGVPPQKGRHGIAGGKSRAVFDAERELSRQAEAAYERLVSDWRSTSPAKVDAGVTPGCASRRPSQGK